MKLDPELYEDIVKAEEITLTNYTEEICWKDAENIEGYVYGETLACIIRDLICEIDSLEELIEEMKNKDKDYEDPYSYEAWEEQKLEEEYR